MPPCRNAGSVGGFAGATWAMIDRWTNKGGNELAGGEDFMLHDMISTYASRPAGSERLAPLEASIARMFDLRMMLDFSIDDLALPPPETTSLGHYALKSTLQYASLEIGRFGTVCEAFYRRLSPAQRDSLSHLDSVAREIARLAGSASGVLGSVEHGGPGRNTGRARAHVAHQGRREPGHDLLVCANTVVTFVDGVMHAMPDTFRAALGKAAAGEPLLAPEDANVACGPGQGGNACHAHCMDLASLGAEAALLVPMIMRLHGGLHWSISMHNHLHKVLSKKQKATGVWSQIHRYKMTFYLRQAVMDLCAFLEVYPSIKSGTNANKDDEAIQRLMGRREAMLELRNLLVDGGDGRDFESFSGMLARGIGHEGLVGLACGILEWLRVNAVHYQTMCPNSPPIPDLPVPEHRMDFDAMLLEVGLTRARAQNALDREKREACPAAQA